MLIVQALIVAIALGKSNRGGRGGLGRGKNVPSVCIGIDEATTEDFLTGTEGLLTALKTGTMYCTLNAGYEEWPACPAVASSPSEVSPDGQRRNLRKTTRERREYNNAQFTMGAGTTTDVLLSDNSADTYSCYQGDQFKFTVESFSLDSTSDSDLGRRLLKKLGGSKVTATVAMTQSGTADSICGISHSLTCSIPRSGIQVIDGVCTPTAVVCDSGRESDRRVKMTCYTEEQSRPTKGFTDAPSCPSTEEATNGNVEITQESVLSMEP